MGKGGVLAWVALIVASLGALAPSSVHAIGGKFPYSDCDDALNAPYRCAAQGRGRGNRQRGSAAELPRGPFTATWA